MGNFVITCNFVCMKKCTEIYPTSKRTLLSGIVLNSKIKPIIINFLAGKDKF